MSKFYIESITAHGSGKNDSVVSFGEGLNIIQGFSNTGKTCVVRCIDFIYGCRIPLLDWNDLMHDADYDFYGLLFGNDLFDKQPGCRMDHYDFIFISGVFWFVWCVDNYY